MLSRPYNMQIYTRSLTVGVVEQLCETPARGRSCTYLSVLEVSLAGDIVLQLRGDNWFWFAFGTRFWLV